jgi:hypothetical protein
MRDNCEHHHRPHHGHHGGRRGCGCGAKDWGAGPSFRRRFVTREERVAWLEQYLSDLRAEATAVEEQIAELKAAG